MATTPDRHTGRFSEHYAALGAQRFAINTTPWCFLNSLGFIEDRKELGTNIGDDAKVLEIIKKQRNCSSWYQWKEFIGPEEHYKEFKMQQLEQDRRKFELKLEEINRQERKRTNRIMVWLAIAAVIFAAMEVYVALALINPEHWLFNWLR